MLDCSSEVLQEYGLPITPMLSGEYQKGDERILGDGDFVDEVLSQAEEQLEERYGREAEGFVQSNGFLR